MSIISRSLGFCSCVAHCFSSFGASLEFEYGLISWELFGERADVFFVAEQFPRSFT